MQNVLKQKNMYFKEKNCEIRLDMFYVLDYSDLLICTAKNDKKRFLPSRGGAGAMRAGAILPPLRGAGGAGQATRY